MKSHNTSQNLHALTPQKLVDQDSITLISTGSTLMPSFSSHWMAALMSERAPSNSSDTIPISSVTLACRTLVMTGNRCVNSQITGLVISFGGYISQSRVFCGALSESRTGEAFARGCFGKRVLEVATGFRSVCKINRQRLRE